MHQTRYEMKRFNKCKRTLGYSSRQKMNKRSVENVQTRQKEMKIRLIRDRKENFILKMQFLLYFAGCYRYFIQFDVIISFATLVFSSLSPSQRVMRNKAINDKRRELSFSLKFTNEIKRVFSRDMHSRLQRICNAKEVTYIRCSNIFRSKFASILYV